MLPCIKPQRPTYLLCSSSEPTLTWGLGSGRLPRTIIFCACAFRGGPCSYKGEARVPAKDISLASVSMLCHFWTLLLVSVLAQKSLAQCFTGADCGGSTVPASSYQQCCDGTGSGVSYFDGDSCTACLLGKPF